jgi:hypothetical protein
MVGWLLLRMAILPRIAVRVATKNWMQHSAAPGLDLPVHKHAATGVKTFLDELVGGREVL